VIMPRDVHASALASPPSSFRPHSFLPTSSLLWQIHPNERCRLAKPEQNTCPDPASRQSFQPWASKVQPRMVLLYCSVAGTVIVWLRVPAVALRVRVNEPVIACSTASALVLPELSLSPEYFAVMLCVPTERAVVLMVAVPPVTGTGDLSAVEPS